MPNVEPQLRANLERLLAARRNYRQEIRELVARYPRVVFYGCGAILNSIVETWDRQVGRKIDFCCDSDPAKWGKVICGARCLSPDELTSMKDQCAVFVTIGDFRAVYEALKAKGFPSVSLLFKYDLEASAFLASCHPDEVADRLFETASWLSDERSRQVFDASVMRVLDGASDSYLMNRVCERNQYFPPDLVRLSTTERLVDVGAYNGDTIRDFVGRVGGRFGKIHAFEVDAANFAALSASVQQMPERDRIAIHNLGAWDRECDITYSIGLSQSTVGQGEAHGHVAPLDQVLKGERVTFLKMDIEGAEPRALRGSAEIIRQQRPTLAICVYHDFRHLWEIPRYIKSLVPEYRIYLRHHTPLEYETVCYAMI